ncbi:hypothetical protein BDD12DRAFT_228403 [Trichophaea hybrida]|nr:hypothetical protein BDD12DRAFT_228403 [Trichophaea hybrida]
MYVYEEEEVDTSRRSSRVTHDMRTGKVQANKSGFCFCESRKHPKLSPGVRPANKHADPARIGVVFFFHKGFSSETEVFPATMRSYPIQPNLGFAAGRGRTLKRVCTVCTVTVCTVTGEKTPNPNPYHSTSLVIFFSLSVQPYGYTKPRAKTPHPTLYAYVYVPHLHIHGWIDR